MSFSVENERGNNFSAREVEILRNLIEKYGKTILCKKTDALGSQAKEKAWLHVTSEFNASTTTLRSVKQLKYKWEYMKRVARKEAGKQKQSIIKTGGGPPPPPMSDTSEWVSSIMKESIVGITSTYDGDSTPNNYVPLDADKVSIVQQLMGSEVNPGPSQDISYILAPCQELSEGAVDVDVTSNIESHIETPFRNIRKRFPKETPLKQSRLSVCTDVMKLKSEKIQLEINVMKETFDLEKKKRKLEEEREKLKFAAEMENIELEKKKKKIELLLLEKQLNI